MLRILSVKWAKPTSFYTQLKLTTAMNTLDMIISTLDLLYMAIYISIIRWSNI